MGTICALNYANIFKGKFEKTCIYPYINSFSKFCCQFIDDIFFLWNGTVVQLQEFIRKLSNCHPAIKFNFKYSKTSIKFLDTTVYINKEQNKLLTTVYCKPTDRRNFLHYTITDKEYTMLSSPSPEENLYRNVRAFSKNLQVLKE